MSAASGLGMPNALLLEQFGRVLFETFGEIPYHVGSSAPGNGGAWRDVDVRLMLDDKIYAAMGLGDPERTHSNGRWVGLTLAFSLLGKHMTGLPIDFQIQQTSYANRLYGDGHTRCAIGVRAVSEGYVTRLTPVRL